MHEMTRYGSFSVSATNCQQLTPSSGVSMVS